jgi:phospholipase/carboxylesterase
MTVPPVADRPPQGLLVMLHGWGANAEDVLGLADYMNLPNWYLVFPNAPLPHPYNPVGRMWYDLPLDATGMPDRAAFQASAMNQRADLLASRTQLVAFLHSLANTTGVPLERTVLGGFSQGGAMTLDVGPQLPLAGLISLSGYLHAPVSSAPVSSAPVSSASVSSKLDSTASSPSLPPILMVHGRQDVVVPLTAAQDARDRLRTAGAQVDYHEFTMGHEIQLPALQAIQHFVRPLLPPPV